MQDNVSNNNTLSSTILSNNEIAISISNAAVNFGKSNIFENANFDFKVGEWSFILGASGVGKTTILNVIADLHPELAQTYFKGTITRNYDKQKIKLSYLQQKDMLLSWLNVQNNITIGDKLRSEPINNNSVAQIAEELNITDLLLRKIDELSGGQRQKVMLARMIYENPSIILMDEPFSALDAITRFTMQDLFFKYMQGKTVIFITHDPMEALRLGHNIYVLTKSGAEKLNVEDKGEPVRNISDQNIIRLYDELIKLLAN